jgi:carboxyl-terminal processing protease
MLGRVTQFVSTQRARFTALAVLGTIAVFTLGLLVGNGHLRITSPAQYKSETNLPSSLNYASVNGVYDTLRQNYDGQLSQSQILDGLKHGLAEATKDPYTEYFTADEAKSFTSQLQGTISGIGAQLELDENGNVVVMSPIDGSPAAAAGVRAKDIITSINGKSTSGMSANDAVDAIRGNKGTKVTLGVLRDKTQVLNFSITRNTIQIPTATSKVLDGGVGYLQISQFSDDTYSLVQQAATKFKQAGVKKLIVDLRDNPGGEVDSAQNISSLWLSEGTLIVQTRRGSTVVDSYNSSGGHSFKGMPTVVLVNAGSASASEITALALRDNSAATIVGEQSYGKGVVQSVIPFSDGSELKVTTAKWYSPKGTNINKKGITPDQIVKMTDDDYKNGTDPQLTAAQAFLDK